MHSSRKCFSRDKKNPMWNLSLVTILLCYKSYVCIMFSLYESMKKSVIHHETRLNIKDHLRTQGKEQLIYVVKYLDLIFTILPVCDQKTAFQKVPAEPLFLRDVLNITFGNSKTQSRFAVKQYLYIWDTCKHFYRIISFM